MVDDQIMQDSRLGTGTGGRAPARSRYPCVDGLRGLAALAVVLVHTAQFSSPGGTYLGVYFQELSAGVQVFFVISGFLLYRPFVRSHLSEKPGPSVRSYARRRAFRIYPAYWLALTASVFVFSAVQLDSLRSAFFNYALLQTYDASATFGQGIGITWTLVVEISFYIALPVIALIVRRLPWRNPITVEITTTATLLAVGLACAAWSAYGQPPRWVLVLPANLAPFALGMALAIATTWSDLRHHEPAWLRAAGRYPGLWWALAAFAWSAPVWLVGIRSFFDVGHLPTGNQLLAENLLRTTVGIALVVPVVLGNQSHGLIRRGLQLKPVVLLGAISYGLYLWHLPIIAWLKQHLGNDGVTNNFVALTGMTLALALPIAAASWFLLERTIMRWSRRPMRQRPSATPSRLS